MTRTVHRIIADKVCNVTRSFRIGGARESRLQRTVRTLFLCQCLLACGIARSQPSASSSAASSQISHYDFPSNSQLTDFLVQSATWYRNVSAAQRIATDPSDLFFLDDNQPLATQIAKLSFDFARADAAMARMSSPKAAQATVGDSVGSSDLARIVSLENQADHALEDARKDVASLNRKLITARGSDRRNLQAALDDAKSRLDLIESGSKVVAGLAQVVQTAHSGDHHQGDIVSVVDDLSQTLPEVSNPASPFPKSTTRGVGSGEPGIEHTSGLVALASNVVILERKLRSIDEMLSQTDSLILSEQSLRNPMAEFMRRLIESGIANASLNSDLSVLQSQKLQLDALNAELNDISPALVALDKQKVLLAIYRSHLSHWRSTAVEQSRTAWKRLVIQTAAVIVVIVLVAVIGQLLRRLTNLHVHDAGRRRLITLTRQIVTLLTISGIAAAALGAEWKSLATFFGLLTAGIAVALQNVFLASIAYLLLVGRRGIRIGDRIQLAGVTGDVIDMGLLQFQLREYDLEKQEFTGHIATFSNSFVFVSPATGLVKLNANQLKGGSPERGPVPSASNSVKRVRCDCTK